MWRWLLLLGALLCASAAAEPLKLQAVTPNVWFARGEAALGSPQNRNFISNAGVVVTPAGVVVIDALGSPALAESLLEAIALITPQPVRYVVLTHYHADHVYGLQAFKAHGATVIAHEGGKVYLVSDAAQQRLQANRETLAPWINADTRLLPADRWIRDDGLTLELGGTRLQIRHAGPAHSPEDLTVFVEGPRVLFAGDLAFRGRIPFVGQADSRSWIAALSRLVDIKPAVIVPGHGPLSTVDDLRLTRDYLQYLRDTMGRAAADMEPFDEAYARTDWSAFDKLPLFGAANRANAFNTYLLMERSGLR